MMRCATADDTLEKNYTSEMINMEGMAPMSETSSR